MSRAYRIPLRQAIHQEIAGEDSVSSQLELLEILPAEAMAELLAEELRRRGFEPSADGRLTRTDGDVTIEVDPRSGTVTIAGRVAEEVDIERNKVASGYDDVGPSRQEVTETTEKALQKEVDDEVARRTETLRKQASAAVSRALGTIGRELDSAVNRVTAEALKRKAAELGSIKRISENEQTGDLEIVVEL